MTRMVRITTWASIQGISAPTLNLEFDNVVNLWNLHDGGTNAWSNIKTTGVFSLPDGSATAPSLTFTAQTGVGLARLRNNSLTFVTNGAESGWVNGFPQIIMNNTSVVNPAYSFALDGGAGLGCGISDTISLVAGTTEVARFNQSTANDDTSRTTATFFDGGNSCYGKFKHYTTTGVSTPAKKIHVLDEYACLVLVSGNDATNYFTDLLLTGFSGSPAVIASSTVTGSPTARTYSIASSTDLKLAMASGTYSTNTVSLQVKAR